MDYWKQRHPAQMEGQSGAEGEGGGQDGGISPLSETIFPVYGETLALRRNTESRDGTKEIKTKDNCACVCMHEFIVLPVLFNCSSVLLCRSFSSGAEGKWPSRHRW